MTETYFSNFNTITYANNEAVDLTERVVVINNFEKNPFLYYPSDITNGIRPDQISDIAYNDSFASWILYLSNDIVDPYYEWYLTDRQFNEYITKKYGSIEIAQQKIAGYINNWVDQSPINVAAFDALSGARKRYWEPQYDNVGRIMNYQRKQDDWKCTTNFIVKLNIVGQTGTYIQDEVVNINYDRYSTTQVLGKAQIAFANSSTLIVKHCSGDFYPHDDIQISGESYVYGTQSQANSTIIQTTIADGRFANNGAIADDYVYWKEQSFYEIEQEKNEGNKTISVLEPQYVPEFIRNTKQLLGE